VSGHRSYPEYARGICEGIAVRAGELALCVGRIFLSRVEGTYALAVLVIGALRESVSRSGKIKPGRWCRRNVRTTIDQDSNPTNHGHKSRGENTYAHFMNTNPPGAEADSLATNPVRFCAITRVRSE